MQGQIDTRPPRLHCGTTLYTLRFHTPNSQVPQPTIDVKLYAIHRLLAVYGTQLHGLKSPGDEGTFNVGKTRSSGHQGTTGAPGSQAISCLGLALKDSREDDEVGSNKGDGDDPVDPDQAIDAE